MKINFENVDWAKVAGLGGALLSLAAAALTNFSNEKELDEKIEKKVQEELTKQGQ